MTTRTHSILRWVSLAIPVVAGVAWLGPWVCSSGIGLKVPLGIAFIGFDSDEGFGYCTIARATGGGPMLDAVSSPRVDIYIWPPPHLWPLFTASWGMQGPGYAIDGAQITMSGWTMLAATGVIPVCVWRRKPRQAAGTCSNCGYSREQLRNAAPCPECGHRSAKTPR